MAKRNRGSRPTGRTVQSVARPAAPRSRRRAVWPWVIGGLTVAVVALLVGARLATPRLAGMALQGGFERNGAFIRGIEDGPVPTYEAVGEAPTELEAIEIVEGYLDALDQEAWDQATGLTVGRANQLTTGLADEIQRRAARRNIEIDFKVSGDVVSTSPGESGHLLADTSFDVEATAETILGSITLIDTSGVATMTVARTAGGVKIADTGVLWGR